MVRLELLLSLGEYVFSVNEFAILLERHEEERLY